MRTLLNSRDSDTDRKVIAHVSEYGKITNRTVQNLFDVTVHPANAIIDDLVRREVLVKTSVQQRGPGVEYGPGPRFPHRGRASAERSRAQEINAGRSRSSKMS
ncbi:MAG: hypothetical protein ACYC65_12820 [Candidatus Limnocylindrales bacterium]